MKRTALLFIICCFVVGAISKVADDYTYLPMLVDGRTWNYVYHKVTEDEDGQVTDEPQPDLVSYTIQGDTVIEGKACKKLYKKVGDKVSYDSSWYEDGKKVYVCNDGSEHFTPMFDFSQKEDNIFVLELEKLYSMKFASIEKDYILVSNTLRRRHRFMESNDGNIYETERAVEGIGGRDGLFGIFQPTLVCHCDYEEFVSCEEDGEVIFTKDDFNKEAYVEPTEDYQPMIKEGRTWRYTYHHWNHEDGIDDYWTTFTVDYTLRGDTIIDGRQCKKMYQKREGLNEKYYGAWYEDGRKVYVIYPYNPDYPSEYNKPQLFFDFGTAIGETSPTLWGESTNPLLRKEDINVYGQTMKRYVMHEPYGPGTIVQGKWGGACFVEGVGSMRGILPDDMTTCICDYETFDVCYENGKTIFTKHDFYRAPYEGAAEPYRQFLKSGKQWVYSDVKFFPYVEETGKEVEERVEKLFAVGLSDPLLINGKECYRMECRDEEGVASTNMLWYEDGGKVYYVIDDDMSHPSLAFDFNLKKDEVTQTEYYDGKVTGFEDFASNNLSFRRVILDEWGLALVEGIGHENGILTLEQPVGIGYAYSNEYFEACYEGDVCIFTYNDFQTKGTPVSDVDGIEKPIVSYPFSQHGKTYDLQGREVTTPQPGHIYIKDGRKFMAK